MRSGVDSAVLRLLQRYSDGFSSLELAHLLKDVYPARAVGKSLMRLQSQRLVWQPPKSAMDINGHWRERV